MHVDERGELFAYRDLFRAAPAGFPGPQRRELHSGAVGIAFPPAPVREINRVIGVGLGSGGAREAEDDLRDLIRWFDGIGGQPAVSLAPEASGRKRLEEILRDDGFEPGYPWQKFRHDGTPVRRAETSLAIDETTDPATFGAGFVAGWGFPPPLGHWVGALAGREGWHCWVVRAESGEPVGCGALHVTVAPQVAWLGLSATRPDQRGRGAQTALFAARIERARRLGCSDIVTETGVPGPEGAGPSHRNMLRAGFVPTYVRPNWVRPEPPATS